MRIFVTGGTGFIGSHFLKVAIDAGHDIAVLRRINSEPKIALSRQPEWVIGNLESNCTKALKNCDTFVHLASYGVIDGMNNWQECFRWNVQASLGLWRQAVSSGIKKFIICGSCFEYGKSGERYAKIPINAPLEPTGAYPSSKAAATMAALGLATDKNLELLLLRPFHIYGEGEDERRFWPSLRKAALAGSNFEMTSGAQVRDFTPVESVARKLLSSLKRSDLISGHPKIENLGTGVPQSLEAFARREWKHFGACGQLKIGALPQRKNEILSYVPEVKD